VCDINWIKTGQNDGLLLTRWWTFRFYKNIEFILDYRVFGFCSSSVILKNKRELFGHKNWRVTWS
jgi:hypothetical protein